MLLSNLSYELFHAIMFTPQDIIDTVNVLWEEDQLPKYAKLVQENWDVIAATPIEELPKDWAIATVIVVLYALEQLKGILTPEEECFEERFIEEIVNTTNTFNALYSSLKPGEYNPFE